MNSQLQKLATSYAESLARSAEENGERATIRENAEKLGIPSKSFQNAVSMVKLMTPGERSDYTNGVNRMLEAIGTEQMRAELFPEVVEAERRRAAREAERKSKKDAEEGRSKEDLDAKSDQNPRSDPTAGGAGKKGKGKKGDGDNVVPMKPSEAVKQGAAKSDAALKQSIADVKAREQTEGDQVLKDMSPQSQSAQAAAKREEAGVVGS